MINKITAAGGKVTGDVATILGKIASHLPTNGVLGDVQDVVDKAQYATNGASTGLMSTDA